IVAVAVTKEEKKVESDAAKSPPLLTAETPAMAELEENMEEPIAAETTTAAAPAEISATAEPMKEEPPTPADTGLD
ncbi:hypothetical protein HAX54_051672, partial [Datura stramonium]|nr:hypothetical protein [Datura stramonium]